MFENTRTLKATQQDPNNLVLTFSYDKSDNVTSISDTAGGLVQSTYDAANRLTSRYQSGTGVTALGVQYT